MLDDGKAARAVARALATLDHIDALIREGRIEEATASARVSWLTDPEFAALPRSTVCHLQMHIDSAWVALSAGDAAAATRALESARRNLPR